MTLQVEIIPVTPFQQNCCLLWDADTKEAVLTDVGGNADVLWARIQELGLDLQQIWLTHGHLDHAGGVADVRTLKDVPVIGPHPDDAFWLDQLPEATAKYGFPVSPVVKPTQWLNEGDVVKVGAHAFQVLHIPGHTPGHVVLLGRVWLDYRWRHLVPRLDWPHRFSARQSPRFNQQYPAKTVYFARRH